MSVSASTAPMTIMSAVMTMTASGSISETEE
jgi:hypothetical protein